MTSALAQVVQVTSVWLVATVMSSVLSAFLYPGFRRGIRDHDAGTRSLATLCYALIAPAVGLATVCLTLAPDYTGLLVPGHCHGGDCGSHAPLVGAGSPGGLGMLAAASLLLFGAVAGLVRVVVFGKRRLATLVALSRRERDDDHRIVDSDELFAWCCGLLRQRIVLSAGLVRQFSDPELDIVLGHERAHAARFDNLRNLTARWATALWPAALRMRIRADLADDAEHACDAAALKAGADPAMFRRVVELLATSPPAGTAARVATFGCADTEQRIAASTASAHCGRHPVVACLLVAGFWSLQFAAATAASHYLVETIAALGG